MQYTSNYNLKKIDLTDSPPDITQLNGNFDVIDSELAGHTERLDAQEVREIDIWASINALGDKVTTPFCVNSGSLDANGLPNILGYANDNNTSTELAFQQPVLTANGTMGGSAFAVSANDSAAWAWYLFSANGGEWGGQSAPSESNPTELQIYNPTPLLVRSISLKNSVTVEQIWSRVIVYGSNNGSTWTQIATGNNSIRTTGTWVDLAVNATVSYKYFKISFTGNTTGAAIAVARISLNATQTITHTGGRVTFKGSIVATTATGKTFTVGSMADIDVSKLTGREFIAFIDTAGATGVTAGTMYAQDTQPTSPASGDIWFKTLEPLACYQYLANTWRERNIVPIGEVYADGTGKITGVSTYPYNQNGYTVNTRTTATASTFGLVRTAAPEDETDCQCDDAALTPGNMYKLADYRRVNTAYAVGDVVGVPYHAELLMQCTNAGTSSAEALDTTTVKTGDIVVDGGVGWTVIAKAIIDASISGQTITLKFADNSTKTLTTQDTVNNTAYKLPYATCSTAKATAAKVATITNDVSFSLVAGAVVVVKFTNGLQVNTAYNMTTLNVNSKGAKTVKVLTTSSAGNNLPQHENNTFLFVYDGTYWNCLSTVSKNTSG